MWALILILMYWGHLRRCLYSSVGQCKGLHGKLLWIRNSHLCHASQRLFHPSVAPHFAPLGLLSTIDLLWLFYCLCGVRASWSIRDGERGKYTCNSSWCRPTNQIFKKSCMHSRWLLRFSISPEWYFIRSCLYVVKLNVLISRGVPTWGSTVSCIRLVWATFHHLTAFSKLDSVTLKTNVTAMSFMWSVQENVEFKLLTVSGHLMETDKHGKLCMWAVSVLCSGSVQAIKSSGSVSCLDLSAWIFRKSLKGQFRKLNISCELYWAAASECPTWL